MIDRFCQGVRVPAIGLGTWELRGDACVRVVSEALALGYRHLDTAQGYGNEAEVGRGLMNSGVPRDEVFVTTKVRPRFFRHADLLRSVEGSLTALGLDAVDLLLLHWPNRDVPLDETLGALHEARRRGFARSVGVSNFNPTLVRHAVTAGPTLTNQIEFHPFLAQTRQLALADELDLLITAYSPVARGRVAADPTLRAIAAARGATPGQVALRWLLDHPRVVVIPKAASPANLAANLAAADLSSNDQERAQIAALARGERLVDEPSVDWEG